MSASRRFYVPGPLEESVELTGPEAHHLIHVLRARPGERVVLFDGRGTEAHAEIAHLSRRTATLRLLAARKQPAHESLPVVVASAVPKGDRFRWLIEKLTELGVARYVPLVTERSLVEPSAGKLEKMQQTVVAACKQAGRARLMQIDPPAAWQSFIEDRCATHDVFVAHPSGKPLQDCLDNEIIASNRASEAARSEPEFVFAVGPEGGFTEGEIEWAGAKGARKVKLGGTTLRVETAAIALAAHFVLTVGSRD